MKWSTLAFLYAFLVWLGPFALSFFFYDREGNALLDPTLLSVMYAFLFFLLFFFFLYRLFYKYRNPHYIFRFAVITFFLSSVLDLVFLVGFFDVSLLMFATQILPIYFLTIVMGYVVSRIQLLSSSLQ